MGVWLFPVNVVPATHWEIAGIGDGKAAVIPISSWNILWQHEIIWPWGDGAIALASLAS